MTWSDGRQRTSSEDSRARLGVALVLDNVTDSSRKVGDMEGGKCGLARLLIIRAYRSASRNRPFQHTLTRTYIHAHTLIHTYVHVPTYTRPFMRGRIELHPDGGREGVDCEKSGTRGGGRSKKHVNSRYGCRAATRLLSRRNIYRASLGICMQTCDRVPSFRHRVFPVTRRLPSLSSLVLLLDYSVTLSSYLYL